jgi:hypothetical protein
MEIYQIHCYDKVNNFTPLDNISHCGAGATVSGSGIWFRYLVQVSGSGIWSQFLVRVSGSGAGSAVRQIKTPGVWRGDGAEGLRTQQARAVRRLAGRWRGRAEVL